jgi:hypothetical protein
MNDRTLFGRPFELKMWQYCISSLIIYAYFQNKLPSKFGRQKSITSSRELIPVNTKNARENAVQKFVAKGTFFRRRISKDKSGEAFVKVMESLCCILSLTRNRLTLSEYLLINSSGVILKILQYKCKKMSSYIGRLVLATIYKASLASIIYWQVYYALLSILSSLTSIGQ